MTGVGRVVHLTSAHPRNDTRIFLKQCRGLAAAGHQVYLVVADGAGDEIRDGVQVMDVGAWTGRRDRMFGATRRVLRCAIELDADIYHFHDPELLPIGLALKRRRKRVVYDAHEDLPLDILSKPYLSSSVRRPIAAIADLFERLVCRQLDAVVAATPGIRDKFRRRGIEAIDVNNYPLLGELEQASVWSGKTREVCYVGGIAAIRGIKELVAAMALSRTGVRLNLAGTFDEPTLRADVEKEAGWEKVNELGFLSRSQVSAILARSIGGVVTFHPIANHIEAQPNKMFEYMSAGVPVIGSNFPLWREIIEGNRCGICIDPLDPSSIAAAVDKLVENSDLAREMGANGSRAVRERYNWAVEEKKLLRLYGEMLSRAG